MKQLPDKFLTLVCQDAFDDDKGQKSAISGRRLHCIFVNFLQCIFSSFSTPKCGQNCSSSRRRKKCRILSCLWLSWLFRSRTSCPDSIIPYSGMPIEYKKGGRKGQNRANPQPCYRYARTVGCCLSLDAHGHVALACLPPTTQGSGTENLLRRGATTWTAPRILSQRVPSRPTKVPTKTPTKTPTETPTKTPVKPSPHLRCRVLKGCLTGGGRVRGVLVGVSAGASVGVLVGTLAGVLVGLLWNPFWSQGVS